MFEQRTQHQLEQHLQVEQPLTSSRKVHQEMQEKTRRQMELVERKLQLLEQNVRQKEAKKKQLEHEMKEQLKHIEFLERDVYQQLRGSVEKKEREKQDALLDVEYWKKEQRRTQNEFSTLLQERDDHISFLEQQTFPRLKEHIQRQKEELLSFTNNNTGADGGAVGRPQAGAAGACYAGTTSGGRGRAASGEKRHANAGEDSKENIKSSLSKNRNEGQASNLIHSADRHVLSREADPSGPPGAMLAKDDFDSHVKNDNQVNGLQKIIPEESLSLTAAAAQKMVEGRNAWRGVDHWRNVSDGLTMLFSALVEEPKPAGLPPSSGSAIFSGAGVSIPATSTRGAELSPGTTTLTLLDHVYNRLDAEFRRTLSAESAGAFSSQQPRLKLHEEQVGMKGLQKDKEVPLDPVDTTAPQLHSTLEGVEDARDILLAYFRLHPESPRLWTCLGSLLDDGYPADFVKPVLHSFWQQVEQEFLDFPGFWRWYASRASGCRFLLSQHFQKLRESDQYREIVELSYDRWNKLYLVSNRGIEGK